MIFGHPLRYRQPISGRKHSQSHRRVRLARSVAFVALSLHAVGSRRQIAPRAILARFAAITPGYIPSCAFVAAFGASGFTAKNNTGGHASAERDTGGYSQLAAVLRPGRERLFYRLAKASRQAALESLLARLSVLTAVMRRFRASWPILARLRARANSFSTMERARKVRL